MDLRVNGEPTSSQMVNSTCVHQPFHVPKMEVLYLYLISYKAVLGVRFPLHKPYPYSLHRWGFLHFRYTPQNKHGTWKWTLAKWDSYWKPSFPGSMLIFWGVPEILGDLWLALSPNTLPFKGSQLSGLPLGPRRAQHDCHSEVVKFQVIEMETNTNFSVKGYKCNLPHIFLWFLVGCIEAISCYIGQMESYFTHLDFPEIRGPISLPKCYL